MSAAPAYPNWIAVDWGTTHLRAWGMAGDTVLAKAASDDGMGRLSRDGYEPALLRMVGGWLRDGHVTPVFACGMAGSRQGWHEAPYRAVPCAPTAAGSTVLVPTQDARLTARLLPGLKQVSPADVMRGEETQIAGVLAHDPDFDGVLCLPGTHSKWARISAGEVVSFQTFMTGEMFALLSQQSVLRHGMTGDGWDDAGFASALDDAISRPDRIAARLFSLRAEGLLAGLGPAQARARLSGLLIGIELAAARPYWLGQKVVIVGAERISQAYRGALQAQGITAGLQSADEMTRAGLASAYRCEATDA